MNVLLIYKGGLFQGLHSITGEVVLPHLRIQLQGSTLSVGFFGTRNLTSLLWDEKTCADAQDWQKSYQKAVKEGDDEGLLRIGRVLYEFLKSISAWSNFLNEPGERILEVQLGSMEDEGARALLDVPWEVNLACSPFLKNGGYEKETSPGGLAVNIPQRRS